MIDSISLDTYVTLKFFSILRDRLWRIVQTYRKDEYQRQPVWRSVFLSPEKVSKSRSFILKGVVSPFVCLWPSGGVQWQLPHYARSSVIRPLRFVPTGSETGGEVVEQGLILSLSKTFELTAFSYYKDFIGSINQDLLELDRLRGVYVNVDELGVKGFKCMFELNVEGVTTGETLEDSERSFHLGAKYKVRCTLPWLSKTRYLSGLRLWMNEWKIFERVFDQARPADEAPSQQSALP